MQQANPVFSVVIPARNMERFIEETFQSLVGQTFADFEVLCIDDGSSDGTLGIIEEFAGRDPRFIPVVGPAKGVSAARNLGLSMARGVYVLFLDADDLLHADGLLFYRDALEGSEAIGALAGVQRINVDGEHLRGADNRSLVPAGEQLPALLKKNFVVNGGALALRTEVARLSEGYDEDLTAGEDWEFWCRVLLHGQFNVIRGPALLYYRQVANGANFKTRSSLFVQQVPCVKKIAVNPEMQKEFGARLRFLLRARHIDAFWSGVRNQYLYGRKPVALFEGFCGVIMYPDSLFRPKLIWRFVRSLDRRV
jgi:glycosyltransferase involved in cell wall biosynthesis